MLFMDLVNKYDEILPPAILKKKRESERKVPVRRRTRPVDMRMSRSRISAGMDLKELQAQQLAQRGLNVKKSPPPVPSIIAPSPASSNGSARGSLLAQVPESPAKFVDEPEGLDGTEAPAFSAEPEEMPVIPHPPPAQPGDIVLNDARTVDYSAIPPPPPLPANIPPPPPLSAQAAVPAPPSVPAPPAHPVFKEPPPETDDLPPRPQFKEPPPEPASPQTAARPPAAPKAERRKPTIKATKAAITLVRPYL